MAHREREHLLNMIAAMRNARGPKTATVKSGTALGHPAPTRISLLLSAIDDLSRPCCVPPTRRESEIPRRSSSRPRLTDVSALHGRHSSSVYERLIYANARSALCRESNVPGTVNPAGIRAAIF